MNHPHIEVLGCYISVMNLIHIYFKFPNGIFDNDLSASKVTTTYATSMGYEVKKKV